MLASLNVAGCVNITTENASVTRLREGEAPAEPFVIATIRLRDSRTMNEQWGPTQETRVNFRSIRWSPSLGKQVPIHQTPGLRPGTKTAVDARLFQSLANALG